MTTIITRLYPTQSAANAARASLLEKGQNEDTIQIILGGNAEEAAAAMKAARVSTASSAAYLQAMKGKQALLVVQAPFNPIGTAQRAMRVLQKHPALDVGLADEDVYLREYPDARFSNSIMKDHPLFMSNSYSGLSHGHVLGSNPIIRSKPRTSAMRGGGHMSRMFWPMKLLSQPKERNSAMRGGMLFSSLFGLPLLTSRWASRDDLPTVIR